MGAAQRIRLCGQPSCSGALRAPSGLPGVSVEDLALANGALDLEEMGMDCADAIHLSAPSRRETMLTFDRRFIETVADGFVTMREP